MTGQLPDDAVTAAHEAVWAGADDCVKDFNNDIGAYGTVTAKTVRTALRLAADDALEAAAPAIAAWAAADERERIRQLAIDKGAVYRTGLPSQRHFAPFADLIGEAP